MVAYSLRTLSVMWFYITAIVNPHEQHAHPVSGLGQGNFIGRRVNAGVQAGMATVVELDNVGYKGRGDTF